jgi:hypothetical protein
MQVFPVSSIISYMSFFFQQVPLTSKVIGSFKFKAVQQDYIALQNPATRLYAMQANGNENCKKIETQ